MLFPDRRIPAAVAAAFERFDVNGSGFLDYRELREALWHLGIDVTADESADILRAYDDVPDGKARARHYRRPLPHRYTRAR